MSGKEKLKRFQKLIEKNTDDKQIQSAKYLIAVVVEYLNYYRAIQSIENGKKDRNGKKDLNNSFLIEIYRDIEEKLSIPPCEASIEEIPDDDKKYYKGIHIDPEPLIIEVNKFPILLNPWSDNNILNNLMCVNENNLFDGMKNTNTQNNFLYPMDIIECWGGNHSQFSARFKNQGKTIITRVNNYSEIYNLVKFDGVNYLKQTNNSIIPLEYDYDKTILFYSGVIFEMGRYIINNGDNDTESIIKYLRDVE